MKAAIKRLLHLATKPWHLGKKDIVTLTLALVLGTLWTIASYVSAYAPNIVDRILTVLPENANQRWALYWVASMVLVWLSLDLLIFLVVNLFNRVIWPLCHLVFVTARGIFRFLNYHPAKRNNDWAEVTRHLKL